LPELVRYRCRLVALRSGLTAKVHTVLVKQGVHVPVSDLFAAAGGKLLDQLELDAPFHGSMHSLRRLVEALYLRDRPVDQVARLPVVRQGDRLVRWAAVEAVQRVYGRATGTAAPG
jgi:hypothetical protein